MTVIWTVVYTTKAEKDLEKLGEKIAKNPYELLEKLTNLPLYKFRVEEYRGIIDIINDKLILHVIKIKHRSQIYKK